MRQDDVQESRTRTTGRFIWWSLFLMFPVALYTSVVWEQGSGPKSSDMPQLELYTYLALKLASQ